MPSEDKEQFYGTYVKNFVPLSLMLFCSTVDTNLNCSGNNNFNIIQNTRKRVREKLVSMELSYIHDTKPLQFKSTTDHFITIYCFKS